MASSRLTISRTQIFSATARIVSALNEKYDTQTTPKNPPRGVQFYALALETRRLFLPFPAADVENLVRSRRPIQAPIGVFPPNKSAGLSARSCVTSQVHEAFLRAIFMPQQGIVSM
jgi:hypothetical protein